jgi:metal-responsive CopG/Arc/MetJ family transcriptional regulator
MKTAVSIPNDIFEQAEALARRTNVSRSELYADAIREFLARSETTTDELNNLYTQVLPDAAMTKAARQTFARSEW